MIKRFLVCAVVMVGSILMLSTGANAALVEEIPEGPDTGEVGYLLGHASENPYMWTEETLWRYEYEVEYPYGKWANALGTWWGTVVNVAATDDMVYVLMSDGIVYEALSPTRPLRWGVQGIAATNDTLYVLENPSGKYVVEYAPGASDEWPWTGGGSVEEMVTIENDLYILYGPNGLTYKYGGTPDVWTAPDELDAIDIMFYSMQDEVRFNVDAETGQILDELWRAVVDCSALEGDITEATSALTEMERLIGTPQGRRDSTWESSGSEIGDFAATAIDMLIFPPGHNIRERVRTP